MKIYVKSSETSIDDFNWKKEYNSEFSRTNYRYSSESSDDFGNVFSYDNDGDWGYEAHVFIGKNHLEKTFPSYRFKDPLTEAKNYVERELKKSE